ADPAHAPLRDADRHRADRRREHTPLHPSDSAPAVGHRPGHDIGSTAWQTCGTADWVTPASGCPWSGSAATTSGAGSTPTPPGRWWPRHWTWASPWSTPPTPTVGDCPRSTWARRSRAAGTTW